MTRFFRLKAWLGGTGLVVGLVGMVLGQRWLVGVGMGLLGVAFILRFAERKRDAPLPPS